MQNNDSILVRDLKVGDEFYLKKVGKRIKVVAISVSGDSYIIKYNLGTRTHAGVFKGDEVMMRQPIEEAIKTSENLKTEVADLVKKVENNKLRGPLQIVVSLIFFTMFFKEAVLLPKALVIIFLIVYPLATIASRIISSYLSEKSDFTYFFDLSLMGATFLILFIGVVTKIEVVEGLEMLIVTSLMGVFQSLLIVLLYFYLFLKQDKFEDVISYNKKSK